MSAQPQGFLVPFLTRLAFVALANLALVVSACAEEIVRFGESHALYNAPAKRASVGLILLPGGDGDIGISSSGDIREQSNWIVRTRAAYAKSGIASLLLDGDVDLADAFAFLRQRTDKIVVVAQSRGSLKIPRALPNKPDAIVFTSSMLSTVQKRLDTPDALPRTLVVHHREDFCNVTHASDVTAFAQWAGARVRVQWIDGGSEPMGRLCGARHRHGFVGRESEVVRSIVQFVKAQ
jgi:hypothetical protein